jgi:hypothetical protein
MRLKHLFYGVPAALFALGNGAALAGKTVDHAGTIACVVDKWDEKEMAKGHKLADSVFRCVLIPDDATAPKASETCAGHYEYMPDGSWKGTGNCTDKYPDGEITLIWEEGSHLKDYVYKKTGGTGKYQGVSGSGTYMYESLTDELLGGRYKGTLELP